MSSIYVVGDVHGCLKTLQALVAKLPADARIAFVGDLIDRGPDSLGVVEYVRAHGWPVVLANHEDMMLHHFGRSKYGYLYDRGSWLMNGGRHPDQWTPELLDWVAGLPLWLEFDGAEDPRTEDGRHLVVTHGAASPSGWPADGLVNLAKCAAVGRPEDYLLHWCRGEPTNDPRRFWIHGHTPVREAIIQPWYANVDTGCVYGRPDRPRKLTALQFPEMIIHEQEYCE